MYRRALLIIMAVVLPASAIVGAFPQLAHAADTPTPYIAPAVLDAAKKSTERNSLAMCLGYRFGGAIKNSDYGYDIDPKDLASGSWFSDYTQVRQWSDYNNGDDGTNCDKINTGDVLQDLGFTSGNIQAACALGIKRQNNSDCVNGTGNMRYAGSGKQDVLDRIDKTYKGTQFGKDYSAEQYYAMAMSLLLSDKTCKAAPLALSSTATADQKAQSDATVTVVGSDGVAIDVLYKFNGNKGTSWSFRNKSGGSTDYISNKCSELANIAHDNANAYAKWVGSNQPGSAGNPGTCEQYATLQVGGADQAKNGKKAAYDKLLTACNDGLANKTTANYCKKYTANDENAACLYGFGTALASTPTGNTDNPTADDKPTCGIQGIGWLVCPAMNFMAKITDEAYNFLASYFLSVDTKLVTGSESAWTKFRDIANVAFVIALIFVVYSQVTSFGISNYGIKRMLPRIIVAALLVNVSFYICAAMVDLSNLLGYAIPQFFGNIPIGAGLTDKGGLATLGSGLTWVAVVGGVIVAAVGVALAISVPVLIAALLAIGLIVLMLVARQALIVLLIVISPLAFVAYLLPNTEQWFKKWYKTFFTLLMLFPVIGTVFGASRMAALIIANAGGNADKVITQLIALAVSAIPFFVVPGLLKGSLSAAGALGAKLQGAANKASGKMGSQVKNTSRLGAGMADMKRFRDQQRQIKLAKGRGTSRSALGAVGRVVGGKKYNERARLHAEGLENKEYEEDVRAAGEYQARHTSFDQKKAIAAGEVESSEAERDAAIRFMMEAGNFNERRAVLESVGSMSGGLRRSAINGARKKGDTGVYGSSTLGQLEDSTADGTPSNMSVSEAQAALSAGAVKRINDGEVTPEVFSRDSYTAGYVAEQSKNANDEAKTRLAQSLTNYAASDQGKKTAAALQGHIDTVVGNAPAGSVQPAPATPIAPAGQQPQPTTPVQPQSPTTLTIPHGGDTPPAAPSPGSQAPLPPGMVQRPSGLIVPSGANNNTPPSPPPSNP